jgi:hypothetical protein
MSKRYCASCGTDNSGAQVYCINCGTLLPKYGTPADSGSASSNIAARRAQNAQEAAARRAVEPWRFKVPDGIISYVILVALGVAIVLAFMPASESVPPFPEVKNPASAIDRALQLANYNEASLSQALLNEFLRVNPPEEVTLKVLLKGGGLTCLVGYPVAGYPFAIKETYRLTGGPGAWTLTPVSASLGLLPMKGPFLWIAGLIMEDAVHPYKDRLMALASQKSLTLSTGLVTFSRR